MGIATSFLTMADEFMTLAPQYFPKDLTLKPFREKVLREAKEMANYLCEMTFYTNLMPEYFSLGHPNAQIDNAFFWVNENGETQCGLTDFGSMSQMQIPTMLQSGWCGAEPEMMDDHEVPLVRLFCEEFEKTCGIHLDYDDFMLHFKIAQATTFCGCAANLGGAYRIMKKDEWENVKSRFDSKIDNTFLLRCYTVQIIFCFAWWRKRSPYPFFQQWMARTGMWQKE